MRPPKKGLSKKDRARVQNLLDEFSYLEALEVLEILGGFYEWEGPTEMRNLAKSFLEILLKEPDTCFISSGGIAATKDLHGRLGLHLDILHRHEDGSGDIEW